MKTCSNCGISKPEGDFYKAGQYFQSRCKPCHNKHRTELNRSKPAKSPKPRGIYKLPKETQEEIKRLVRENFSLNHIGNIFDLNISTLANWKKNGQLS